MIVKKVEDKYLVYDKTNTKKELDTAEKEVNICPKIFEGEKEMLEMEIDNLENNIARQQVEVDQKKAILTAINATVQPK